MVGGEVKLLYGKVEMTGGISHDRDQAERDFKLGTDEPFRANRRADSFADKMMATLAVGEFELRNVALSSRRDIYCDAPHE